LKLLNKIKQAKEKVTDEIGNANLIADAYALDTRKFTADRQLIILASLQNLVVFGGATAVITLMLLTQGIFSLLSLTLGTLATWISYKYIKWHTDNRYLKLNPPEA